MKPIKQLVYLPANGDQEKYILSDNDAGYFNGVIEKEGYFFTPEQLNEYTQNVIKQALDTAAENANDMWLRKSFIDKQSITNTFEETFNKFKIQ